MRALVVTALAVIMFATEVSAEPSRPTLLVVRIEGSPLSSAHEAPLLDALALVIDGLTVAAVDPIAPGFAELRLDRQVALVREEIARRHAVAATWLTEPVPGQLMLHLVASRTGQTIVRSIPAQSASQSATSLALAVRELLGTSYLFEPDTVSTSPAIREITAEVSRRVPRPRARWLAELRGSYSAQLSDADGEGDRPGVELALRYRMVNGLMLGVHAGGGVTAFAPDVPSVESSELWLGAEVAHGWMFGRWELGPWLNVSWMRQQFDINDVETERVRASAQHLRLGAGPQLAWKLTGSLALVVEPGVEWRSGRDSFVRMSSNETVYSTATFHWVAKLAVQATIAQ